MTSTRAINAAAGVIHAAMQQGKTIPTSIAYALDSAGLLNSPEIAAELEHLRKRVAEAATEPVCAGAAIDHDETGICNHPEVGEFPEALIASSGAVIETRPIPPREDAYRSPLHHDYRTPHDLPPVTS